jgi:hypothetical protein
MSIVIMNDSTNISDLPTDPAGGRGVISMSASENNMNASGATTAGINLDQTTINQIVSGLQQATAAGATMLPSRDIPMTTESITSDPQIHPNYLPPIREDYIANAGDSVGQVVNDYNRNMNRTNSLDDMYNELQTPILLAVLYFLFQLPLFRRYMFNYFPVLFSKDGNMNVNGYVFNSVLFGLLFYLLNKITVHFGQF